MFAVPSATKNRDSMTVLCFLYMSRMADIFEEELLVTKESPQIPFPMGT